MPIRASLACLLVPAASPMLARPMLQLGSTQSLSGRWFVTLDIHGTRVFGSMKLEQHGEKISGTYHDQKLEGSFKGDSVHLVAEDESGREAFDATL